MRRNRVLQSIQQKIVRNWYQITEHALDEMRKDELSTVDVKRAIRVGVCQECGQRYYAAATLGRLDAIAQNSDTAPERISVPVMVMSP